MYPAIVTPPETPQLAGLRTSTRVTAGVAVITFVGRLVPSTMPTCRTALDAVLHNRVPEVVLDLSRAELDPTSIAMLTWMHRYVAHFGVSLTLSGVSRVVSEILEREHLDSVFRVRPTDHAERRATARADHGDQWPTPGRQRRSSPSACDPDRIIRGDQRPSHSHLSALLTTGTTGQSDH
jgi:anti-anti-sigma regulatory factor